MMTAGWLLRRYWPYLVGSWLGLFPLIAAAAQDFRIADVRTYQIAEQYFLSAHLTYDFNLQALTALDNGVPLTVQVQIQVRQKNAWIWENSVIELELRYQIRYKPLSKTYLITRLFDHNQRSYMSRDAAIAALGELSDVALVTQTQLQPDTHYRVHLRTALDIEALPLPLRPTAYLHPNWQQTSEWTTWALTP